MSEHDDDNLTYRDAGVDIAAADAFIARISWLTRSTHNAGVVENPGAYAGLFRPDLEGMERPVLAAACDGVGTKLLVAREVGRYEGLGQDLVAMNVNDLLPSGARPLFFLDYIATGAIDSDALEDVIRGVAHACTETGCALLGGETAEMPGLYREGEFDLAGFAVGIVDEGRMPRGEIEPGDRVLALPSSGIHSNGLSLARKALLERGGLSFDTPINGRTLGEELLEPTRLYVNPVLDLLSTLSVKGGAHVTGGGLLGRGYKLMPEGCRLVVDAGSYPRPEVFDRIGEAGSVAPIELASTFNMGLGFLAVVSAEELENHRESVAPGWLEVGTIEAGTRGVELGYAHR